MRSIAIRIWSIRSIQLVQKNPNYP